MGLFTEQEIEEYQEFYNLKETENLQGSILSIMYKQAKKFLQEDSTEHENLKKNLGVLLYGLQLLPIPGEGQYSEQEMGKLKELIGVIGDISEDNEEFYTIKVFCEKMEAAENFNVAYINEITVLFPEIFPPSSGVIVSPEFQTEVDEAEYAAGPLRQESYYASKLEETEPSLIVDKFKRDGVIKEENIKEKSMLELKDRFGTILYGFKIIGPQIGIIDLDEIKPIMRELETIKKEMLERINRGEKLLDESKPALCESLEKVNILSEYSLNMAFKQFRSFTKLHRQHEMLRVASKFIEKIKGKREITEVNNETIENNKGLDDLLNKIIYGMEFVYFLVNQNQKPFNQTKMSELESKLMGDVALAKKMLSEENELKEQAVGTKKTEGEMLRQKDIQDARVDGSDKENKKPEAGSRKKKRTRGKGEERGPAVQG